MVYFQIAKLYTFVALALFKFSINSPSIVLWQRAAIAGDRIATAAAVAATSTPYLKPIRVAVSIDENSLKDLAILVNSIIESAIEPAEVIFHIVACGKDTLTARALQRTIENLLGGCFPSLKYEAVAFTLPEDTGFYKQLERLKEKSHHWNSQSGADMVRFFLARLFPHVDRLLYIDNDVVVSCCLEEIWSSELEEKHVIGIALDSLRWAADTQFKRHYNGTHPLVIKNMRRHQSEEYIEAHKDKELTQKEFADALPRYPNDGVLLIDVQKYNKMGVLDTMDEIALANSRGENAVNLGTQQFTVLALYDRWKEITPRANLRHSPDMARGYLMWFYYNGFIHYAGATKPKALCLGTNAENAAGRLPYLRVGSYMPWALSNYQVAHKCPQERHVAYVPDCVAHVVAPSSLPDFYHDVWRDIQVSRDPSLLYLHIGPLHGDLSASHHKQRIGSAKDHAPTTATSAASATRTESSTTTNTNTDALLFPPLPVVNDSSWESASTAYKLGFSGDDLIETLDRIVLHESTWSFRSFDHKTQRLSRSTSILEQGSAGLPPAAGGKKGSPARTYLAATKHLCDTVAAKYRIRLHKPSPPSGYKTEAQDVGFDVDEGAPAVKCVGLLDEIRAEGRKHWDAQLIVVDVTPPHIHIRGSTSTSSGRSSSSSSSTVTTEVVVEESLGGGNGNRGDNTGHMFSTKHTSLGVLLNLDLVFMRPKFIIVRLAATNSIEGDGKGKKLEHEVHVASRFLQQNGYLTVSYTGRQCGQSWTVKHAQQAATIQYACVTGTRVTEFEFFTGLLT